MKVLALLVPVDDVFEYHTKLRSQGLEVFHTTKYVPFAPGMSYIKMFLNDEQEAFLRLTYRDELIYDLTSK